MIDTAATVETDRLDASLDGALAHELADLLRSLLVGGVGALELGLEGRSGHEGLTLGIVHDHGIDVGVGADHAQARALGRAEDLPANATLTALEAGCLRFVLIHLITP